MNKIPRKKSSLNVYKNSSVVGMLIVPADANCLSSQSTRISVIGLAVIKMRTILVITSSFCSGNDDILVESDPFAS